MCWNHEIHWSPLQMRILRGRWRSSQGIRLLRAPIPGQQWSTNQLRQRQSARNRRRLVRPRGSGRLQPRQLIWFHLSRPLWRMQSRCNEPYRQPMRRQTRLLDQAQQRYGRRSVRLHHEILDRPIQVRERMRSPRRPASFSSWRWCRMPNQAQWRQEMRCQLSRFWTKKQTKHLDLRPIWSSLGWNQTMCII